MLLNNPPGSARGYDVMYPLEGMIEWDPGVAFFDWKEEYAAYYNRSKEMPGMAFWLCGKDPDPFPKEDRVFAYEQSIDNYKYWLCTKPEELRRWRGSNRVAFKKADKLRPYGDAPLWKPDDELTMDSEIEVVQVSEEVGLYYRDLWVYKLGSTKAEKYFLLLVDGKVLGTVGFHMRDALLLKTTKVGEVFGFTAPSDKYPNINRLLMTVITCREMGEKLRQVTKTNRLFKVNGIRTACVTKYRTHRLNKGLLEEVEFEKQDDGRYYHLFECEFRDESFQEALQRYLEEFREKYADRLTTQDKEADAD